VELSIDGPTKLVRQDAILGGLSIGQLPLNGEEDREIKWGQVCGIRYFKHSFQEGEFQKHGLGIIV